MTDVFSTPPGLRGPAPLAALLASIIVLAVVVTALATRGGGDATSGAPREATTSPEASPEPTSTPLADLDTTVLTVQRAAFCDLVDPAAVESALGGEPADVRSYGNGESVLIASGIKDISHEFGCRWKRGRAVLRGWVFAPPVTPADARLLRTEARRADDCVVRRAAPAFGAPTLARTCSAGKGSTEASFRGLFGDAWLACSLTRTGAPAAVLDRAGEWCAAVARAAATPPLGQPLD